MVLKKLQKKKKILLFNNKRAVVTLDAVIKLIALFFIFSISLNAAIDYAHNDRTKRQFNAIDFSLSLDTVLGMGEDVDFYFVPLKYHTPHELVITENKVVSQNPNVKPFASHYVPNKNVKVPKFDFSLLQNDASHVVFKKRGRVITFGEFTQIDEVDFKKITVNTRDKSLSDNILYLYLEPQTTEDQTFIAQTVSLDLSHIGAGETFSQLIGMAPDVEASDEEKLEHFKRLFGDIKSRDFNPSQDLMIAVYYNENLRDYYNFYFSPKLRVTISEKERKKIDETSDKSEKLARIFREQIQIYTKKIPKTGASGIRDKNLIFGDQIIDSFKTKQGTRGIPHLALLNPSYVGVVVELGQEVKDFTNDKTGLAKVIARTIEKYYDDVGKYLVKTYGSKDIELTVAKILGKEEPFSLVQVPKEYGRQKVQKEVLDAFIRMSDAAADGVPEHVYGEEVLPVGNGVDRLRIQSGYRSYKNQRYNVESKLGKRTLSNILESIAFPGTSRHGWGTEIDVKEVGFVSYDAETSQQRAAADWLVKYAHYFGFCIPYDKDRTEGTDFGITHEPWHISYKPISSIYYDFYVSAIAESGGYEKFYIDNKLTFKGFDASKFQEYIEGAVIPINEDCKNGN